MAETDKKTAADAAAETMNAAAAKDAEDLESGTVLNDMGAEQAPQDQAAKRPFWKRCLRLTGFFAGGTLLLVLLLIGAGLGFLQTKTGQQFVQDKLNEGLASSGIVFTEVSGSIPFDTTVSLKMQDQEGAWFELEHGQLILDFHDLSKALGLSLKAESGHLFRLPPASAEEPAKEEEPSDLDIPSLLQSISSSAKSLPSLCPGIRLNELSLNSFQVARGVFDDGWNDLPDGKKAADDASSLFIALTGRAALLPDEKDGWEKAAVTADLALSLVPNKAEAPLSLPVSSDTEEAGKEASPAALRIMPDLKLDALSVRLTMTGTMDNPQVSLESGLGTLACAGRTLGSPHLLVKAPEGWLPDLLASKPASLHIEASTKLEGRDIAFATDIQTSFQGLAPTIRILPALAAPGLALNGDLTASLAASFFEAPKQAQQPVQQPALQEGQQKDDAADDASRIKLPLTALEGGLTLNLTDLQLVSLLNPDMKGQGTLNLSLSAGREDQEGQKSGTHELKLACEAKDFALADKGQQLVGLGSLSLQSHVSNIDFASGIGIEDILAGLALEAKNIKAASLAPISLSLKSDLSYEKSTLSLTADGGVKSRLALAVSAKEKTAAINTLQLSLPAYSCGLRLQSPAQLRLAQDSFLPVSIQNLNIRLEPEGQIQCALSLETKEGQDPVIQGKINAAVNTKPWQKVVSALPPAVIKVQGSFAGSMQNPNGSLKVDVTDLALPVPGLAPISSTLAAKIASFAEGARLQNSLKLAPGTLQALGLRRFDCEASLLVPRKGKDLDFSQIQTAPLHGKVSCQGALAQLWKLAGQPMRRLAGDLALNAALTGTLASPILNADVNLKNGAFTDLEFGAQVKDITLAAKAACQGKPEGTKVDLNLSLSDGRKDKGTVTAKGTLFPVTMRDTSIKAAIRNFAPLRRQDIKAVLSGDLAVTGLLTSPEISGRIAVDKGNVLLEELNLPSGSVTTLPLVEGPKEKVLALRKQKNAESKKTGIDLPGHINLNIAVGRLFVEGYGLETEWKADLNASGPLSAVGLTGDIQAVRGRLNLLDRKFNMEEGKISFLGGTEPFLNLKMTTSANAVDASVVLEGSLNKISKLKPRLESSPSMPEDDILSYLLFGKPAAELSQFEMLQLAKNVAVLAAFGTGSGTRSAIKNVTGLDVMNISQDKEGHASVEMGKYLFDNVYAGVQKNAGSSSETSAIVRWELNKNANAEVKTGGSNTSVGVKWKMDY